MAKSYYSLGRSLSRAEAIAGWCYLPFYLVLLSAGIQYLAAALHVSLTALTINIIYFSINLLFVLLVFRNFLLLYDRIFQRCTFALLNPDKLTARRQKSQQQHTEQSSCPFAHNAPLLILR